MKCLSRGSPRDPFFVANACSFSKGTKEKRNGREDDSLFPWKRVMIPKAPKARSLTIRSEHREQRGKDRITDGMMCFVSFIGDTFPHSCVSPFFSRSHMEISLTRTRLVRYRDDTSFRVAFRNVTILPGDHVGIKNRIISFT